MTIKQKLKQFGKRLEIAFTVGFVLMGALIALAKHLSNKM